MSQYFHKYNIQIWYCSLGCPDGFSLGLLGQSDLNVFCFQQNSRFYQFRYWNRIIVAYAYFLDFYPITKTRFIKKQLKKRSLWFDNQYGKYTLIRANVASYRWTFAFMAIVIIGSFQLKISSFQNSFYDKILTVRSFYVFCLSRPSFSQYYGRPYQKESAPWSGSGTFHSLQTEIARS